MKHYIKVLVASIVGNALEFFNFTLYAVCTPIIARLYFPFEDEFTSIITSWTVFAVGFFMRPIGAMIFGRIGDKKGRKVALIRSIAYMSLISLGFCVLPTYETIGIFAPIILIILRLLQGICAGGEFNGAIIFALEHLGQNSAGRVAGAITGSAFVGAMLATLAGLGVHSSENKELWWRMPFLIGAIVGLVGMYIRKFMDESPEFKKQQVPQKLKGNWMKHWPAVLLLFVLACLDGSLSYTLFGFLNNYLHDYVLIPMDKAISFNIIGVSCYIISCPLCGYILDKVGSRKYFFTVPIICGSLIFGAFFCLSKPIYIVYGQVILGTIGGAICGPLGAFAQSLFPVSMRYRLVSLSYCLGIAIGGGCTPLILTALLNYNHNLMLPAYYIGAITVTAWLGVVGYRQIIKSS